MHANIALLFFICEFIMVFDLTKTDCLTLNAKNNAVI